MTEENTNAEDLQKWLLRSMKDGLKDIPLWDLIRQLEACRDGAHCPDARVRIVFPGGKMSCVGKIFGVSKGDGDLTVYLFPVPENIEEVNERVASVTKALCEDAGAGRNCIECGKYMTCPHVTVAEAMAKAADASVRQPGGICGKRK